MLQFSSNTPLSFKTWLHTWIDNTEHMERQTEKNSEQEKLSSTSYWKST